MHESARPAPVPKGELPVRRGVRSQMVRFAKTDDSAVVVKQSSQHARLRREGETLPAIRNHYPAQMHCQLERDENSERA